MTSPFGPLRVIVCSRANRGGVGRALPALRAALDERGLEHDVVEAPSAAEAERAARAAFEEGVRYLVAAGEDPTIGGVVNGMLTEDGSPWRADAVLGVAWSGSKGDMPRTFGLDRTPEVVAEHLAGDGTMTIDVGVAEFVDPRGEPARRLFVNVAEVGWGAHLVRLGARMPRWSGRVGHLLAAFGAIRALDRQEVTVTVAHTCATVPLTEVVVANCQFTGTGMKIAPRALPDDGRFNVQVFTGDRSQVFLMTQQIFRGEHLPHPQIIEWQSPAVDLAPPRPLPVAADGEFLGYTPATFSLAPCALRLKI
ncbi:MAG: diacylglycerol/lipid kinase family protein [Egibacteraceae bacterium]